MSRAHLDIAVKSIEFAREYTETMLQGIEPADWFRQPSEGVTHIAWQVGHLAMAEYALTMIRVRGKEREDQEAISNDFFRLFQKGTTPQADADQYPPADEIRHVFDEVHRRALSELSRYTDEELNVKLPVPHAVFDTKLGSVFFCPAHEMLHAGQIGLLRRMFGHAPLR